MAKQKKREQNRKEPDNTKNSVDINSKPNKRSTYNKAKKYSKRKSKYDSILEQKHETYMSIPLVLIAAVVPLIVFVRKVVLNDPGNMYWDGTSEHFDIFIYYKMVYLLIFTVAGGLLYLCLRKSNPFDRSRYPYYIPIGVYCLMTLLSAVSSEHRHVAFFGILERYEGALVLIGYAVILFLVMNVFKQEKTVKMLFGCLLTSAAVISIIGVFQYFGMDLFQNSSFQRLITPLSLANEAGKFALRVNERTIFSTLYNPNYVGSYMAMVMPVIIVLIIWAKKTAHKLILAALLALTIVNWIGCDSRAGLVGAALAFLVLMILYRRKIWQRKWIALAVVVVVVGGLAVFNFTTNGSIVNRVTRMLTLEGKEDNDEVMADLHKRLAGLTDVRMDDEKAEIVTEHGTLCITLYDGTLGVYDENGKEVASDYENNVARITDERFDNIRLSIKPEEGMILVNYNDYELMDIILTNIGLRSTSNRWMIYRDGRNIESYGFEGMEAFGSNRGYIWSRTLPLLKDTIFIGKGPDTFALYFPQYDFLNKLKLYQTGSIFVDKAHNMYLQTALQTGLLSLLAMLVLFAMYVVSSIKAYWKSDFSSFLSAAGAACFASFCGYAAAGLFNDSTIAVAPVFWVLMGLGIGINLLLYQEKMKNA